MKEISLSFRLVDGAVTNSEVNIYYPLLFFRFCDLVCVCVLFYFLIGYVYCNAYVPGMIIWFWCMVMCVCNAAADISKDVVSG